MADVDANINIGIDSSDAILNLRTLESRINQFQRSINSANATAAANQAAWNRQLLQSINNTGLFDAKIIDIQGSTKKFSELLEKNKLSLGEYARGVASQLPLMSKVFRTEFDTISQVAESRVKKIQTQYIALGKTVDGVTQAIAATPLGLAKGYNTDLAIATQRQQILNKLIDDGSTKLLNWGKNTQWAGRQLMVGFSIPLAALGGIAAKTFMEIDKASLALRRVYGDLETSTAEIDANISAVRKLGSEYTKYGISVSETIGIAGRAAATGAQNESLMAATEQTLRFATLGQIDYNQALDSTIALQTAFGISNEELAQKIDFLNAVENQTILTIDDMSLAIPRVATVIKGLGGDVEDLAVMMTAMREGGVSAENAANALKSGLASLINPTKRATESLAKMRINITEMVDKNKGDLMGLITDFANATNALDEFSRQQVFEQVFGKYQYARMSALFTNITKDAGQASRAMELAGKSAEELAAISEKELGAIADTTTVKFQAAMEQLKSSLAPIGEAFLKAITPIAELATKLLDAFNQLPDGVKNAIAATVGIIGGIGPVFLMLAGLIGNGIANIVKGIQFLRRTFAKIRGSAEAFTYMADAQLTALSATERLELGSVQLTDKILLQSRAVDSLTNAYIRFANAAGIATDVMLFGPGGVEANPKQSSSRRAVAPRRFADGGRVPGTGNTDSIPALLTPGESVVTKQATQQYGPIIDAMNNGSLPGFNKGVTGVQYFGNNLQTGSQGGGGVKLPKTIGSGEFHRSHMTGMQSQNYAKYLRILMRYYDSLSNKDPMRNNIEKMIVEMFNSIIPGATNLYTQQGQIQRGGAGQSFPGAAGWEKLKTDNAKFNAIRRMLSGSSKRGPLQYLNPTGYDLVSIARSADRNSYFLESGLKYNPLYSSVPVWARSGEAFTLKQWEYQVKRANDIVNNSSSNFAIPDYLKGKKKAQQKTNKRVLEGAQDILKENDYLKRTGGLSSEKEFMRRRIADVLSATAVGKSKSISQSDRTRFEQEAIRIVNELDNAGIIKEFEAGRMPIQALIGAIGTRLSSVDPKIIGGESSWFGSAIRNLDKEKFREFVSKTSFLNRTRMGQQSRSILSSLGVRWRNKGGLIPGYNSGGLIQRFDDGGDVLNNSEEIARQRRKIEDELKSLKLELINDPELQQSLMKAHDKLMSRSHKITGLSHVFGEKALKEVNKPLIERLGLTPQSRSEVVMWHSTNTPIPQDTLNPDINYSQANMGNLKGVGFYGTQKRSTSAGYIFTKKPESGESVPVQYAYKVNMKDYLSLERPLSNSNTRRMRRQYESLTGGLQGHPSFDDVLASANKIAIENGREVASADDLREAIFRIDQPGGSERSQKLWVDMVRGIGKRGVSHTGGQGRWSEPHTVTILYDPVPLQRVFTPEEESVISDYFKLKERTTTVQFGDFMLDENIDALIPLIEKGYGTDRSMSQVAKIKELEQKRTKLEKLASIIRMKNVKRIIPRFAEGGDVAAFTNNPIFQSDRRNYVPGVGNTDTVPAMLTPGEFVINKQATAENLPLLQAINSGEISGFNKGGKIPGIQYFGWNPIAGILNRQRVVQKSARQNTENLLARHYQSMTDITPDEYSNYLRMIYRNNDNSNDIDQIIAHNLPLLFDDKGRTSLSRIYSGEVKWAKSIGVIRDSDVTTHYGPGQMSEIAHMKNLKMVYDDLVASGNRSVRNMSFDDFLKRIKDVGAHTAGVGTKDIHAKFDKEFIKEINKRYAKMAYGLDENSLLQMYRGETGGQRQLVGERHGEQQLRMLKDIVDNDKTFESQGWYSFSRNVGISFSGERGTTPTVQTDVRVRDLPQVLNASGYANELAMVFDTGATVSRIMPEAKSILSREYNAQLKAIELDKKFEKVKDLPSDDPRKMSVIDEISMLAEEQKLISRDYAALGKGAYFSLQDSYEPQIIPASKIDERSGEIAAWKKMYPETSKSGGLLKFDPNAQTYQIDLDYLNAKKIKPGDMKLLELLQDNLGISLVSQRTGSGLQPIKLNNGNIVPGMGNTDTVPAMLTPGEFVINKQSTQQNLPLLHAINNGENIMGMNKGGRIPGVQYFADAGKVRKESPKLSYDPVQSHLTTPRPVEYDPNDPKSSKEALQYLEQKKGTAALKKLLDEEVKKGAKLKADLYTNAVINESYAGNENALTGKELSSLIKNDIESGAGKVAQPLITSLEDAFEKSGGTLTAEVRDQIKKVSTRFVSDLSESYKGIGDQFVDDVKRSEFSQKILGEIDKDKSISDDIKKSLQRVFKEATMAEFSTKKPGEGWQKATQTSGKSTVGRVIVRDIGLKEEQKALRDYKYRPTKPVAFTPEEIQKVRTEEGDLARRAAGKELKLSKIQSDENRKRIEQLRTERKTRARDFFHEQEQKKKEAAIRTRMSELQEKYKGGKTPLDERAARTVATRQINEELKARQKELTVRKQQIEDELASRRRQAQGAVVGPQQQKLFESLNSKLINELQQTTKELDKVKAQLRPTPKPVQSIPALPKPHTPGVYEEAAALRRQSPGMTARQALDSVTTGKKIQTDEKLTKEQIKAARKQARIARAQRLAGPLGGLGMGISMASMMPAMAADEQGKFMGIDANAAMMGLMGGGTLLSMLPMLGGAALPVAGVLAAATAVGVGLYAWRKSIDSTARKTAELGANIGGTANSLNIMAKVFGQQTPAQRQKQLQFAVSQEQIKSEEFGQFQQQLSSDAGQAMLKDLQSKNTDQRIKTLTDYITNAIAAGIMDSKTGQLFAKTVGMALNDVITGTAVASNIRGTKTGAKSLLELAQKRRSDFGDKNAAIDAINTAMQDPNVEKGTMNLDLAGVETGVASYAIGGAIQVIQDYSNVIAKAREEYSNGTLAYQDYISILRESTNAQEEYASVVRNAISVANDPQAVRGALDTQLIASGLSPEQVDALTHSTDIGINRDRILNMFNLDNQRSAYEAQYIESKAQKTLKKSTSQLSEEELASLTEEADRARTAAMTMFENGINEDLKMLAVTGKMSAESAAAFGAALMADPLSQAAKRYAAKQKEGEGIQGAEQAAFIMTAESGNIAGISKKEDIQKYIDIGIRFNEQGGNLEEYQALINNLPDRRKIEILTTFEGMRGEDLQNAVTGATNILGLYGQEAGGRILSGRVREAAASRRTGRSTMGAMSNYRTDEDVELLKDVDNQYKKMAEVLGPDIASQINVAANTLQNGTEIDFKKWLTDAALLTNEAETIISTLPKEWLSNIKINFNDPSEITTWANISEQIEKNWNILSSLNPNINMQAHIRFLTVDSEGNKLSPEQIAANVGKLNKAFKTLATSKNLKLRKEAMLTVITSMQDKNGNLIDPAKADSVLKDLASKFGGKIYNVDPSTLYLQVDAIVNYDGMIQAGKDLVDRGSALAGDEAGLLSKQGQALIRQGQALINAGQQGKAGAEAAVGNLSADAPSSGGGGGGATDPFKDLMKNIMNTLKMFTNIESLLKKYKGAKNRLLKSIQEASFGGGLADKLRGFGLDERLIDQILSLGFDEAKKVADKLAKNVKQRQILNQGFIRATAINQTANAKRSTEVLGAQQTAAQKLRQGGRSEELVQFIAGDADKAQTYVGLLEDVKNGYEGAERTLRKWINAQAAEQKQSVATENSLKSNVERAKEDWQQYYDKQIAMMDQQYSNIEMTAYQTFKTMNGMSVEDMQLQIDINNDLIDTYREKIQVINDEIRAIETRQSRSGDYSKWGLEQLQKEIELTNRQISALERQNEMDQRRIDTLRREDELRNRVADALNHDLEIMSSQEEKIRETYQKRIDALDEVAKINDHILESQRQQLGLSQALSQGDIYAATAAAQEMRQTQARFAQEQMRTGLQTGMEGAISGLRTSGGLTREQAEAQIEAIRQQSYQTSLAIRAIEDQIYNRQINEILPLKDKEYNLNLGMRAVQDEIAAKQLEIRDIERSKIEPITRQNELYQEMVDDHLLNIQKEQSKVKDENGNNRAELERMNNWILAGLSSQEMLSKETRVNSEEAHNLSKQWQNVAAQIKSAKDALKGAYEKIDTTPLSEAYTEAQREAARAEAYAKYVAAVTQALQGIPGIDPSKFFEENKFAGGSIRKYAQGNYVFGSGGRDSVPAMLTPGEFVVRKAMVDKYGIPMLNALNQGALGMPRYNVAEQSGQVDVSVKSQNTSNIVAPMYNNYSVNVNVSGTNASADEIANRTIMKIKQMQNSQIRSGRGY